MIDRNLKDEHWMAIALSEAEQGIGLTAPNPPVGAVIVRNGQELSRGWHQKAGTNHAERDALSRLQPGDAEGATIYVTLEPCSTKGMTGACTDAIIEAGITRVVYATSDPNPAHSGNADRVLMAAGIKTQSGILHEKCSDLIRGFAKVQIDARPWVIAKTAMSLDGKITRPPGEDQWLTSPESRENVQLLRAEVDAIITSGETVRIDDPMLTLRSSAISPKKKQPLRVILTRNEIDHSQYQIFNDGGPTQVFQNTTFSEVLRILALEGKQTVLLESGGELIGAFLEEGLIDEFVIYYAPIVTGGSISAISGKGAHSLSERLSLKNIVLKKISSDLCIRGIVDRNGPPALDR